MFGSARPPDTSLTICAPLSSATFATSACMVSMLDGNPLGGKRFDHGSDAGRFHRGVDPDRTGAGRFPAHIDDRGPRGGKRQPVFDGAIAVDELATVGERIVGHIHHAHDLHARSARDNRAGWVHFRRMSSSASARDALSVLNCPRTADVVVTAPGLRTPRIAMQRCSASITTMAPRGSSLPRRAHRRSGRSGVPAPADASSTGRPGGRSSTDPVTRPSTPGMYPTWATPWNAHQMVLAGGVQRDLLDQHELVVLLVKGGVEHRVRIRVQTGHQLLVRTRHPSRGVQQTPTIRVLTDGDQQLTNGRLGSRLVEHPRHRIGVVVMLAQRLRHRSLRSRISRGPAGWTGRPAHDHRPGLPRRSDACWPGCG